MNFRAVLLRLVLLNLLFGALVSCQQEPKTSVVNGVEVVIGEDFSHQFDLMELDPAPVRILAVGVEGAGWDPRVGEVFELELTAGF